METWKVIALILGGIGALFAFYFRESFKHAKRKKIIAVRLESYLNNWMSSFVEKGLLDLVVVGQLWQKESVKASQDEGIEGLQKINKKYEEMLDEIKIKIKEGDERIVKPLIDQHQQIKKMSESVFDLHLKHIDEAYNSMMNNTAFISDEEAAEISWVVAQHVVNIRNYISELVHSSQIFFAILRSTEEISLEEIADPFYSICEKLIRLSKHLDPLIKQSQRIRQSTLLELAIEEMLGNA